MTPTVQWQGDNASEFEKLLSNHLVRADKHGDQLVLLGVGIHVTLNLGDSVLLDGDALGVQRADGKPVENPSVTWKGSNLGDVANFLTDYKVTFMVMGETLHCIAAQETIVLARGDKLINRYGQIIVSKAGVDHANG